MPVTADRQRFRNEDLILKVSPAVDRSRWDESRYEDFIERLCGGRAYQEEAIRTALRYLLGGEYADLTALARDNYDGSTVLEARYGSWQGMERRLQLPALLSASLDLATGTGKSYVLYGLAAILLAHGVVDRVLVLCPSTTIEAGLLEKFRELASDSDLRDLLPPTSAVLSPRIINASETITEGSICVENYHAILEHVGSSIRDSLWGKGARVAVLNDEAHHVANEDGARVTRWKQFLTDPGYGFRYVVGVSGTCYVKNDYFADVIYRYSLRQAIEDRYVKDVRYVTEMPTVAANPNEKWQLVHSQHKDTRQRLRSRGILPLTIVVTPTIAKCEDRADALKAFLVEIEGITPEEADRRVLVVYNNAPDVRRLPYVDTASSPVEWIVSVSMLNEGWDVKRVFQIVPDEERAFNSKLLIAQVLGRGLRLPVGWTGPQPEVIVFNHDAWASQISHLVNEILEIESRISTHVLDDSPHHFMLHNIDYTREPTSKKKPMEGEYTLFAKGFVDVPADAATEDVSIETARAITGDRMRLRRTIHRKTYTPREIAVEMYRRLEDAENPDDPDEEKHTGYTDKFPVERLEEIVRESLARRSMTVATDLVKQKFLQALGTLRRTSSENVRYTPIVNRYDEVPTRERPSSSVSAAELRNNKIFFFTDRTRDSLKDEQIEFFDKATEPGSVFRCVKVDNRYDFRTPVNAVVADSDPERRFINGLLAPENLAHYDAWLKSTATGFYEIDFYWKKGEHPRPGKFSPDFFIKAGDLILVVEVKDDAEKREPSEENRKKNEYALAHFDRLNVRMTELGSPTRYKFNFLTPENFGRYFQYLRNGQIEDYESELDVKLAE